MITSITTKTAAVALITWTLTAGEALGAAGSRWYARLEPLAWVPAVLWKLCARIRSMGAALEALAERVAPRLGIDMETDVLEPMIDRACRA